jgi:hypothetical protein
MQNERHRGKVLFFVLFLMFGLPFCGLADDTAGKSAKNKECLRLDLNLYFWPAGVDGDVGVGSHAAHSSVKFGDLIHDLKMGANGAFKISKGDWFLLNDFIYLDLSHKTDETIPPGVKVDATLDTRLMTDLFAVGRQWEKPFPWNLFMGARYFYGKLRLDAVESLGPFHAEAVREKTKEWVVPTVGAGVSFPLNSKFSFNVIADIGAADNSFSWEAIPALSWKISDMFSVEAGYRLLEVRHKEDDFKIDALMHGPIVGMKMTF